MFEYEEEVRALERGSYPAHPVVFYGSSMIRLWDTLGDFPGVPIANLGFGGSTLAEGDACFERLVVPRAPRSIVLYGGDNDFARGATPDSVVDAFRRLHAKVDALPGDAPVPLAYLSIKPSPARWNFVDYARDANRRIQEIIATRPASRFVDVFTPMLGNDGLPRPDLFVDDDLHMNPAGYEIWRHALLAHSGPLLFYRD